MTRCNRCEFYHFCGGKEENCLKPFKRPKVINLLLTGTELAFINIALLAKKAKHPKELHWHALEELTLRKWRKELLEPEDMIK